jgi:hypothetical protein
MGRLSLRRAAAIKLADITRVAAALQDRGEILDPAPWLMVFANILSSAPKKWLGDRRGPIAPEYFGLSDAALSMAARRAGLRVTRDQIANQVAATKAWRKKESDRLSRPHYVPMAPATIGRLLGVTAEVRLDAKAWSIIPYGTTKEQMMEQARERHRGREFERKRAKGARPRELSLSRTKPWARLGISRRTWYRQGKPSVPEDVAATVKEIKISDERILH